MSFSFYWHDYETSGTDPARDRPIQFAGVRTDADLNEIGEPLMLYARLTPDILPQPKACLVTGLTPQEVNRRGLAEPEFIARVLDELGRPGTCGVGYNSLRFDDEFTRYTLYRNFFDPYEREWKNNNSRWDLIDVVRLTRALRPDGIQWPEKDDGRPSMKLEDLTAANGIDHGQAHDALADVRATIALARLIKQRQPKLFDYALSLRRKRTVAELVDLDQHKPLLHVSDKLPWQQHYTTLVMPVAWHPVNKNELIVVNLNGDIAPLLALDADAIREKLFTPSAELAVDEERIPLKTVHINKSPILATAKLLDAERAKSLQIDLARCEANWARLREAPALARTLCQVYAERDLPPRSDPELRLYEGFLSDEDRRTCAAVRAADAETLAHHTFPFQDPRLPELLFRYRARHYPHTLTEPEQWQWREYCERRLSEPDGGGSLTLEQYVEGIKALQLEHAGDERAERILHALIQYVSA